MAKHREDSAEVNLDKELLGIATTHLKDETDDYGPADKLYRILVLRLMFRQANALDEIAEYLSQWRDDESDVVFDDEDDYDDEDD